MEVLTCFASKNVEELARWGSVMLYGTCGGGHLFTVYLTRCSALALLHEKGRDATQSLILSRTELLKMLNSPEVPDTDVVRVWKETCYPLSLIGG